MIIYIILWLLSLVWLLYFLFLYLFHLKLKKLWDKIDVLFHKKSQIIPALYEISRNYIIKPDEIFSEILALRLEIFTKRKFLQHFYETISIQQKIHKELDFIFRVASKHPKLIKDYKFYYLKETIFQLSEELWDNIQLYKNMSKKFNKLRLLKYFTLIGIFIPVQKKEEI